MYDIISVGDTTLDVFLEIDDATVLCDLHREHCRLCFNYADKIPVRKVTKIAGVGNAANNAVGSSRLGMNTALYSIVGNDDTGKEILKNFKKEKVSLAYVQTDKEHESNFSAVLNFKGERTILVFHEKRHYDLPKFSRTRWIYYTSLAAGHEKLHTQIPAFVKKNKVKLGFNPGTHQLREGVKVLRPILQVTEVLLLNKEEAQRLVGELDDVKKLLRSLLKLGPKIAVITDGPKGAYAFDGKKTYFLDIFDSPVVERTGCGDAFSTGFLAGLFYGHTIPEAMRWGSMNSASVLQYVGAQKGLLTKKQMESVLKKNSRYQAKEV